MVSQSQRLISQKQKDHLKYLRKKYRIEVKKCTNKTDVRLFIFQKQLSEDLARDRRLIANHHRELRKLFNIHPELRSVVCSPALSYGKKGVKTPYIIGANMRNYQLETVINRHIDPATRTTFNEAFSNVDEYFGIASQALGYGIEKMCLELKPNSTFLFTSMRSDKICFDLIMQVLRRMADKQLALKEATNDAMEKAFSTQIEPDQYGVIRANNAKPTSKAFLLGFEEGIQTASMPLKVVYSIKMLGIYHNMLSVITRYCERVHQE